MKKFVLIYHTSPAGLAKMGSMEPEVMQAEQKKWMDWFASLGDNVVDMGEMFAQSTRLGSDGFGEVDPGVTGYTIIQAEDFEAAKKAIESHPHIAWAEGCVIDMYEPMDMGAH